MIPNTIKLGILKGVPKYKMYTYARSMYANTTAVLQNAGSTACMAGLYYPCGSLSWASHTAVTQAWQTLL